MRRWLPFLVLLLLPWLAAAQDAPDVSAETTAEDKGFLTSFLERNLSGLGRTVTVDGFQGALSSRATFRQLTIADDQGIWITIRDGAIQWNRAALLSGRVEIDELSAATIDLVRAPSTGGAQVEAKAFSLPELPVSVQVSSLRTDRLTIGPAILGEEAVVTIAGSAELEGGQGTTDFSIRRIDGREGDLTLKGSYANATRAATLDLLAREGADGIAARLLNLPGRPPAQLALHGSGTLDDFTAELALSTDGAPRLTGQVRLTAGQGQNPERRFSAKLDGDITPLLQREYRDFFGTSVSLEAEGLRQPGVRTELTRFVLDSDGVDMSGRLMLSAEQVPLAAALTVRLGLPTAGEVRLPLPGDPTYVRSGTLILRYDAAKGDVWQLKGDMAGFRHPQATVGLVKLDGNGRVLRQATGGGSARIVGRAGFDATGLALRDPGLAGALGPAIRGSTVFSWRDGQPLRLRGIAAEAGDLGLDGDLSLGVEGLDLIATGDLKLRAANIARFSALAGRPLGGQAQIALNGRAGLVTGAFDLNGMATGRGLSIDQPQVDRLLAGRSEIAVSARRDVTGITIDGLDLTAPGLTASGKGTIRTSAQDLSAHVDFTDLSGLGNGFAGRLSADATLSGPTGARAFQLDGTAQDLRIGVPQVDALLAGRSEVTLRAQESGETFDLTEAQFSGSQLSASVRGTGDPGTWQVKTRLADIGKVAPGVAGPLTTDGTVARTAGGYGIDVTVSGPGRTSARVQGTVAADFASTDLRLAGSGQSALLNAALAPRSMDGTVSFDLSLAGPPALSSLSGRVSGRGLRIALPTENIAIEDGAVSADIAQGRALVQASGGIRGGGRLTVSGPVDLAAPYGGDLTVDLDRARVSDPDLFSTTVSGRIRVTGPLTGGATIGGRIELVETEIAVAPLTSDPAIVPDIRHVNEPEAARRTRFRAGFDAATRAARAAATPLALDLTVSAPARLFVRGRGLDAEMGGEVLLRGTTEDVHPSGEFTLIRGRLNLLGKRFVLDDGIVQLTGSLVPYIRFAASADTFGTTSTILVEGPANAPEISFSSSTGLPEEEVLSQLLFGSGIDDISAFQLVQLANAVATLSGRGGNGIVDRLRRRVALDDLDVIADDKGNAALKAGKYLSPKLYSEATVGADGKSKVELNLDLNPNVTLRGTIGTDGQTGAGVFYDRNY